MPSGPRVSRQAFGVSWRSSCATGLVSSLPDSVHTSTAGNPERSRAVLAPSNTSTTWARRSACRLAEPTSETGLFWAGTGRVQPLPGVSRQRSPVATGRASVFARWRAAPGRRQPAASVKADQRFEACCCSSVLASLGAGVVELKRRSWGTVALPHAPSRPLLASHVAGGAAGFLSSRPAQDSWAGRRWGDERAHRVCRCHAKAIGPHHPPPRPHAEAIERRGALPRLQPARDKATAYRAGRPQLGAKRPPGCASGRRRIPASPRLVAERTRGSWALASSLCAAGSGCWADRNWREPPVPPPRPSRVTISARVRGSAVRECHRGTAGKAAACSAEKLQVGRCEKSWPPLGDGSGLRRWRKASLCWPSDSKLVAQPPKPPRET